MLKKIARFYPFTIPGTVLTGVVMYLLGMGYEEKATRAEKARRLRALNERLRLQRSCAKRLPFDGLTAAALLLDERCGPGLEEILGSAEQEAGDLRPAL